jgi:hypothetical protein
VPRVPLLSIDIRPQWSVPRMPCREAPRRSSTDWAVALVEPATTTGVSYSDLTLSPRERPPSAREAGRLRGLSRGRDAGTGAGAVRFCCAKTWVTGTGERR